MKYKLKIQYTSLYHSLAPEWTNEAHKITHSRLEYIRLIRSTAWVSNLFMAKGHTHYYGLILWLNGGKKM
jgi:hypothetical protein